MSTTIDTRFDLPLWVAAFGYDQQSVRPSRDGLSRVGAFDVQRADTGATFCTFGAPGRPSTVLFDGYLFDRDELCEQLHVPGTASCAQIVASAYQAWGVACLSRLEGAYLVAIADADSRQLFLGRDPMGRHPLFYSAGPRDVWFGANVLTLASSREVSNTPNRLSLALAAMTLWPAAGETFFADIKRLRPGYYLEVAADRTTREQKYWDAVPETDADCLSEREALDAFEPALSRAVSRCMELAPDGLMLSGGVDSVTLAALATKYCRDHTRPPIVALSGQTDELLHEWDQQTQSAGALGMPHVVKRKSEWTRNRNEVELSLEVTPQLPGPSRIYWVGSAMGFFREAVHSNLHTLLTGSGADNWLSVADAHAADLLRRLRLGALRGFIRAETGTGGASYRSAARHLLWHGALRPFVDSFAMLTLPRAKARYHRSRAAATIPAWLCPDLVLRDELIEHLASRRTPALDSSGRIPRSYLRQSLSDDNQYVHHEFETTFHVERLCGLRLLVPYHDASLVQLLRRIPPQVLLHGNKYKGLLRPVVERHLPGLGFGRQRKEYPKQGQDLVFRVLRDGVTSAWRTHQFETLSALNLVNPRILREDAGAVNPDSGRLVRMFALMSAELWTSVHTGR